MGSSMLPLLEMAWHGLMVNMLCTMLAGLPHLTIGWWAPVEKFGQLMPIAIVVMLVDLLESTSIARALARKNGYELNYNLVSGWAN